MQFRDYQNIHEMFRETVDRRPDEVAVKWFTPAGETKSLTWAQFYNETRQVSKSLMALGVRKDDKVSILSYTCPRWVLCDLGITSIGAVTVGIYHSNLAKDCQYIINHSDSVVIFAEDEVQLAKLTEIRADIPRIRKVILFSGEHTGDDDWIMSFDRFLNLGEAVQNEMFLRAVASVEPGDPAGIIYTSGTTGVPKGAVLTHDNITFTPQSVRECADIREDDETFLFLPLAHVFARTCFYTALLTGCTTIFNRRMETLIDDLKAARPHWFASVPRVFEKAHSKIISRAEAKGGLVLKLFRWACKVGARVSQCKLANQPVPPALSWQYRLAARLVFSKVRAALGGRVRWCISGAAPLNPDIGRFFHGAGILILEGIGMTENTSFSNVNRPDRYRFGWVGPPGPGIEQRADEDGEILFRGRNVMKSYYKMPDETGETITNDGWLLSGDLGEIDAENFLRITGRKKDLIITAGGKNIAPALIEGVIATSKYINQVCVIGDGRKFLTALITLNPETVADYARAYGIPFSDVRELGEDPRILALIKAEVAEKNRQFASFESVKKVAIVSEFTIEDGLLTPTMKIKRHLAFERYRERIDAMYPSE